jgi:heme-degrading monooxygenase HmoA
MTLSGPIDESNTKEKHMIARVWHGVVPREKADGYAEYLSGSARGVSDYERTSGNRGTCLMRRTEGARVHFLLISFWDSREAISAYAGADIERAQYFPYDLECLEAPEPNVSHYEVLVAPGDSGARGPHA